ncbi:MAG: ABC transporter permease [Anaerolineae bacterium]|nr:ABC transporter permease [Anaerolineae bacterium]
MNAIRYTLSVMAKELQVMVRARGSLALFLMLPLLIGGMMGGANLASANEEEAMILLRVSLVNQDAGDFGREVANAIESIEELSVTVHARPAEAEDRVAKGEAAAAIVIPAGFSDDIMSHTPTAIDVIVDPGEPESASIVTGIMNQVVAEVTIWGEVQYGIHTLLEDSGALAGASPEQRRGIEAQTLGVVMTRLNEMRRTPAIALAQETLEGAKVGGGWEAFFAVMFPAIAVMFIYFAVSWLAPSLLEEREAGTLRRLLAAPIPRGAVIAGKMLAFVILACVQIALMFAVASLGFNMPLGRSPLGLVVVTVAVALNSTALGVMVAALARSSTQASSIGVILGFVLGGVGGCIGAQEPFVRAGGFLGVLSSLTPQGHAIDAYYRLLAESGGLLDVLPRLGILLAAGALFFAIAVWRLRFE